MEKLDLSKLKLASSSLGERIMSSSAQMGRTISSKMKEILQTPTPESKIVDEATSETLEEPDWGLNLRICAMIGREEYDGAEIVRAIKKKLIVNNSNNNNHVAVVQGLSLDLLEACTSNCEKVFSEVASEKVLDDMVRLIEDSRTDHGVRVRAMQLIRAWGESRDLEYLPVFNQTYMHLKSIETPPPAQEENLPPMQYSLESYLDQPPLAPPERYPVPTVPNGAFENEESTTFIGYGVQSTEEKKEFLVEARNGLDILSSILNSETEPKPLRDDLTTSMLEKCKQSLPVVQRIIQTTSDDEVMLFDALNLHDELQQVISRYEELTVTLEPEKAQPNNKGELSDDSTASAATFPQQADRHSEPELVVNSKVSSTSSNKPNEEEQSSDKSS